MKHDSSRFVLLEHDHPELHWDFMLEVRDVLKTWRLFELPQVGSIVPGELSFDHRQKYLEYEGPISGNRGWVKRTDWGTYKGSVPTNCETTEKIELRLYGQRLVGLAILIRENATNWSLEVRP